MFRTLTARQLVVDLAVPAAFGLLFLPFTLSSLNPFAILVLAGLIAAVVMRRLSPTIALGLLWAATILQVALQMLPSPADAAVPIVVFSTAAYGSRVIKWVGFASSFAGAALAAFSVMILPNISDIYYLGLASFWVNRAPGAAIFFVAALGLFLLSWTLGLLVKSRGTALDTRKAVVRAEQEVVAEQERTRIARDMHDVVAHSLAVVVAQADGARYLRKTDPDAVDEVLQTISTTAREALSDVRVLLAQLRHTQTDAPQPTLVDLDRLFEQLRSSGLTIEQVVSGTPIHLGTSGQLAVFRIVQESLTNALRHSDTRKPVDVRFSWTPHGLDLVISSALKPPSGRTGELRVSNGQLPLGHGIAGMRERALLVGGHLTAAEDGGRYVVHAWLPAQADTAALDIVPVKAKATVRS